MRSLAFPALYGSLLCILSIVTPVPGGWVWPKEPTGTVEWAPQCISIWVVGDTSTIPHLTTKLLPTPVDTVGAKGWYKTDEWYDAWRPFGDDSIDIHEGEIMATVFRIPRRGTTGTGRMLAREYVNVWEGMATALTPIRWIRSAC